MVDALQVEVKSAAFEKYGLRHLYGHRYQVLAVAWSCDGKRLASGGEDSSIRVWSVEPYGQVSKQEKHDADFSHPTFILHIAWHPKDPGVLATICKTNDQAPSTMNIRILDARNSSVIGQASLPKATSLSWEPDGNAIAVCCLENSQVHFLDWGKYPPKGPLKPKRTWTPKGEILNDVAWGPTKDHFTVAMGTGTIRIATLARPDHPIWELQSHTGRVDTLVFSPSYKYLASGGQDACVSLWDLDNMICIRTFTRPDMPVRSITFSHDSKWLAYSSEDALVEVVSPQTGELACTMSLRNYTDCVAWNPSSHILAIAGGLQRDHPVVGIYAPLKAAQ